MFGFGVPCAWVVYSSAVFVVKSSGRGFRVPVDRGVARKPGGGRVNQRVGPCDPEGVLCLDEVDKRREGWQEGL